MKALVSGFLLRPAPLPPVALVCQLGAAADPPPAPLLIPVKPSSPLDRVFVVE